MRDEPCTLIGNVALVRSTNKHVFRMPTDETGMTTYTDTYLRGRRLEMHLRRSPCRPGQGQPTQTIVSVYIRGVRQ